MLNAIRSLMCKFLGHNWSTYIRADKISKVSVCMRCGETK